MIIVLDANVLIAAFATHGLCQTIFEFCLEECEIVICAGLIDEVRTNLVIKLKVAEPIVEEFYKLLEENSMRSEPASVAPDACRDPNDLYLLGLSKAADAQYLITGDKDLQDCKKYGKTLIVSPREFWEQIRR